MLWFILATVDCYSTFFPSGLGRYSRIYFSRTRLVCFPISRFGGQSKYGVGFVNRVDFRSFLYDGFLKMPHSGVFVAE